MKATKKLVAATISLIAAASLTVGSTFAWFSYQSDVSIGSVNFSVDSSDENLQVAVVAHNETTPVNPDLGDFSYTLDANDIKAVINSGTAIKYAPLTVQGNTVAATDKIDLVEKDETTTASLGSYALFDLVFRYTPYKDAAGQPATTMPQLVLNYGSVITTTTTTTSSSAVLYAWGDFEASRYGIALKKNDAIEARARDAARVAFLYTDTYDSNTIKNKVWAPSESFDGGISQSDTSDVVKGFYNGNLASDYNLHNGAEGATAVTAPTYASRVYAGVHNPATPGAFTHSAIAQFPTITGTGATYSELRLTVKVWLEGKDGDCIESVREDDFAFTLKFRTSTLPASSGS